MQYLDCNCRLGRYNAWSGREPITREQLLETMDHYGIHEALFGHTDYLLPTDGMSAEAFAEKLDLVLRDRAKIRDVLRSQVATCAAQARKGGEYLAEIL